MTDKQQDTKNKVKKGYLKIHVAVNIKTKENLNSLDVTYKRYTMEKRLCNV